MFGYEKELEAAEAEFIIFVDSVNSEAWAVPHWNVHQAPCRSHAPPLVFKTENPRITTLFSHLAE